MSITGWVIVAVVVVGVVIALFGWDRYHGNRKGGKNGGTPSRRARCSSTPPRVSGCGFGTTPRPGNENTGQTDLASVRSGH